MCKIKRLEDDVVQCTLCPVELFLIKQKVINKTEYLHWNELKLILLSLFALSLLLLQYPITTLFYLLDPFSYPTVLKAHLIRLALICIGETFRQWLIRNTRKQTQINPFKFGNQIES